MKYRLLSTSVLFLIGIFLVPLYADGDAACGNRNNGGAGGGGEGKGTASGADGGGPIGNVDNTPPGGCGDPVIPYTGNEFKEIDDLTIWGSTGDLPMVWSRHANSRAVAGASLFGMAHYWRHGFQWELSRVNTGATGPEKMTLIYPDGGTFTYTEVAPNEWSVGGTSANIFKRTATGFSLQTQDSFRYEFTSYPSGKSFYCLMTSVLDPSGNRFLFEYDSARRLVRVQEPAGRFFRIYYTSLSGNKLTPSVIARLGAVPAPGEWIDLPVSKTGPYQYVRVVSADGSYGKLAEVEVYEEGTDARLGGATISSDPQEEAAKALDGNPATAFVSASASGGFVGLKLPEGKKIGRVRVLPQPGSEVLQNPSAWSQSALRVEASNEAPLTVSAISRVETSDGRAVDYSYEPFVDPSLPYVFPALAAAVYGDGSRAEYRHTQVFPGTRPLVGQWDDVRYGLRQCRYQTTYQNGLSEAVLGAVTAQVNLETGGEILRIGLKNNGLHKPMVSFANGASVVQYYGTNKQGGQAITRKDDANGNPTTYTFDANGFIATEKDALGRVTSFTYSPSGQVASKTHPDGTTESWTYNALGSLVARTDELGRTTSFARDGSNRVIRIDYPDASSESFTYNGFGQILTHRQRNGGTESREYDGRGLLVSVTDALGQVTGFAYDSADRLAAVTDPLGNTTRTLFNERGLPVEITCADGSTRTYTYTKYGDVASETNELGNTTSYTYDIFRRVTSVTNPLGRTALTAYHPDCYEKNPASVTAPTGEITRFSYDKAWNVLAKTLAAETPQAATTTIAYDKANNPVTLTDAMGRTTRLTYDARNRRATSTDPLGNITRWTYDAVGNTLTETRPDGGTTTHAYDPMNRLTRTTDPKGQTTSLGYNAAGSRETMTDPRGQTYRWTYDLLERPTAMLYPGGSREQYRYDAAGNPVGYTTRAGQVRTSVFDVRNREIETNWSDTTPDIARTYDVAGRILSEDNGTALLTYTYDAANQLTGETTVAFGQPARTVSYTYDGSGRPIATTYPDGNVVASTYTARGEVAGIWLDGTPVANYEYNPVGSRTAKSLETGITARYTYDAGQRLTGIEHRKGMDLLVSFAYTLDSVGNRKSKTQTGLNPLAESYNYDPIDQLIQAKYGTLRTVGYQYDPAGNRQSVSDGSVTTTYAVDADNAYTQVGGEVSETDANGNHAGIGGTQYTYDAQNRLTRATVSGVTTSFAYDARNRVIRRTYATGEGTRATQLTYSGWNLIEERDGAGNLEQVYIHGAGTDELLVKITSTAPAYYHHDGLGSVIALTDETGTVIESYTYDAFGSASVFDSSLNLLPSSLQSNRFLFTGREWLAGSNLYDYRNRVYSPELGRFLQTDPIRFSAGDANIYRYCGNNPINRWDPFGLCEESSESWWSQAWNTVKSGAEFLKDFFGGASDFFKNYLDMREANTIGADKYFHAKANYEATSRGTGGEYFAEHFSNAREVFDQNIKGSARSDSIADQEANAYGRSQVGVAPDGRSAAAPYRPKSLDPKY